MAYLSHFETVAVARTRPTAPTLYQWSTAQQRGGRTGYSVTVAVARQKHKKKQQYVAYLNQD